MKTTKHQVRSLIQYSSVCFFTMDLTVSMGKHFGPVALQQFRNLLFTKKKLINSIGLVAKPAEHCGQGSFFLVLSLKCESI